MSAAPSQSPLGGSQPKTSQPASTLSGSFTWSKGYT